MIIMERIVKKDIKAAIRNRNAIYPFTNEDLSEYINYFENRQTMLSVVASGDQIFNAILKGTKEVEAFDINPLVKYYFYLKKAAIETLTREEFIKMFIDVSYMIECSSLVYFDKILLKLDSNTGDFWYELMKGFKFSWYDLFYSNMFYKSHKDDILANPYLGKEEYQRLRGLLKDTHIAIKDGNILDLADSYSSRKFDLIYLSNIWEYLNLHDYFEMQKKLKLTPNGCLVAYCFKEVPKEFKNNEYEKKGLSLVREY